MLFCQCQHPMLTLVSSILVHTIQSCAPMCGRHHKGQQSFSLTFRHDVHIQQSFPDGQIVPDTKQHLALFRVRMFTHACLKQSISPLWSDVLFRTHPLMAGSQQHVLVLCLLPISHVHRCQLESMGLHFLIQVITFHSQGSADEDLPSFCDAGYCSFQ